MTKRKVPGVDSRKTKPIAVQTIESMLARTEEDGECLVWTGYIGNNVPQVSHGGKVVAVRRLLLELHGRVLKPGDHASPSCCNPSCVNPEHIVQRTAAQHSKVMHKAPRNQLTRGSKIATFARATRSKLDIDKARAIRSSDESGPVLAERYGVNKSVIARIRNNIAWKDYSSPFAGLGAR